MKSLGFCCCFTGPLPRLLVLWRFWRSALRSLVVLPFPVPEGTIGALRNFDDAEKLSIVPQEVQVTSLILDIKLVNQLDL
jgi:hypothetical protein